MTAGTDLPGWLDAWRAVGARAPDDELGRLRQTLLAAWSEPQRHYHTLQHLDECLALLARHARHAQRPAEVALALWFHDAVYAPQRGDNEAASADWARSALLAGGVAPSVADRVHALVMSTAHHATASHDAHAQPDAGLLVDIDLAIIGAPPARFAQYERQIRAEYAHVTPEAFSQGRRALLTRLRARSPLFQTPAMRVERERQARSNLDAALDALA